ncbi:hypothetical protein B14911_08737 [Bacillus sp. NRRL B-14911]|nr:hypothetical protein B14911_08737 [Bacillus sp. NRRL B-14911]
MGMAAAIPFFIGKAEMPIYGL